MISLFVAALFAVLPGVAQAQSSGERDGGTLVATAVATEIRSGPAPTGGGGGGGGTHWPYECTFRQWDIYQSLLPIDRLQDGFWYRVQCTATQDGFEDYEIFTWQYNPGVPLVNDDGDAFFSSLQIVEFARATENPPALPIGISPEDRQVTGLESWLWPDGPVNVPIQATAHAGTIEVTVQATWESTRFVMGDGTVITCTSQTIWSAEADGTDCSHTYFTEGTFIVSANSTWSYVWWDNANTQIPVSLGTESFLETEVVEVIDIESVISGQR